MAKALDKREWKAVEKSFYEWCLANNKISINGFYKSLKKPSFGQRTLDERAKAEKWKETAQKHLDAAEAPKLRKELEKKDKELEDQSKAITQVEIITGAKVDPQGAIDYIDNQIQNIKQGMGNNIESFCLLTEIVKNQLAAISKIHHTPMTNDKGDLIMVNGEIVYQTVDSFQAQSVKSLVGALKDIDLIMRRSVQGNVQTMKELYSVDDQFKEKLVEYKERIKITAKDSGSDKQKQTFVQERIKSYQDKPKRKKAF